MSQKILFPVASAVVFLLSALAVVGGLAQVASADAGANGCNTYFRFMPAGLTCIPTECVNLHDSCVLGPGPMGQQACNCNQMSNLTKCVIEAYQDPQGGWHVNCLTYMGCPQPQVCKDDWKVDPVLGWVITCECK